MLGIEPRAVRITWSVLLTVGAVAFLYTARRTILIFVLAIFFAYLLSPVVSLVDRFAKVRRTLTLALVYAVLIAVLITTVTAIGSRASAEAANLISRMPDLAKTAGKMSTAPLPEWLEFLRGKILIVLQEQVEGGLERALPILRGAIGQLVAAISNLGFALLVPILGFFFLKDGQMLRNSILDLVGSLKDQEFFDGLMTDIHVMLGYYVRALFGLSFATFLVYAGYFSIAGVPYASLLATIAALLEFIPVLGPLAAAVCACVVALISGYGSGVGWMVAFFVAYRIFQDYVLTPFLMGSGLALHPLLVIFGALAGEQIAGIPGMFFSAPVLAALRLIYVRTRRRLE
ncbi:MAG: AI-2E family transporter [Acidobacteria bacterium]|nr:AI-2E family transporter [Acidobacteriota bacterium]